LSTFVSDQVFVIGGVVREVFGGRAEGPFWSVRGPIPIYRQPVTAAFEQETTRVIKDATRYAFENCGAKPGDMLTPEQTKKLVALATERMMPFIQRHVRHR
jgi:hypothetical protein